MSDRSENKLASERRYRESHRTEINARTRQEYASRRGYFREYYLLHKPDQYNECPDCRRPKIKRAKRCESCAVAARTRGRPRGGIATAVKSKTNCPYCDTELRTIVWHGREFEHCPGCGLETTAIELRRMALEEEVAA